MVLLARIMTTGSGQFIAVVRDRAAGATTCRIYEHPELVYKCEWTKTKKTPNPPSFAQLAHMVEAALGQKWIRSDRSSGGRATFQPKDATREGTIELTSYDTPSRRVELVIHRPFDRPVPSPTERP